MIRFRDAAGLVAAVLIGTMAGSAAVGQQAPKPVPADTIKAMVARFKADPRGPYQGIRWFCPDGSVRPAHDRCPGGKQHALIRDSVRDLGERNDLFLGQILTDTPYEALADRDDRFDRAKQYQMEKFLQSADDGWILRQARYYRGAVQAEDEEDWGSGFLTKLLADTNLVRSQFFLVRQLVNDIPNGANDSRLPVIRALAKTIADSVATFRNLRIKIHGHPDSTDIASVRRFRADRATPWSAHVDSLLGDLTHRLVDVYAKPDFAVIGRQVTSILAGDGASSRFQSLGHPMFGDPRSVSLILSDLLFDVREAIPGLPSNRRLEAMRLSLRLEQHLFRQAGDWKPASLGEMVEKTRALAKALAGTGLIERWEWDMLRAQTDVPADARTAGLAAAWAAGQGLRRAAGWGAGMVDAHYASVVRTFTAFEPLATGFIDDRVRSSILLRYGESAGALVQALAESGVLNSRLPGGIDGSEVLGLNPGLAKGVLRVITGSVGDVRFRPDGIYLMAYPPADMKPVAGIATVSEGNPVSHVQLLARNLGIPNATLPIHALRALAAFDGREAVMAVSPRGSVVIKLAAEMTPDEAGLLARQAAGADRLTVPTDRLRLDVQRLPSLRELRKTDSGVICGPKAANLAELRHLFPDRVAAGLVIPFGVYKRHMLQPMPGTSTTYWRFLQDTWQSATEQRQAGAGADDVETFVLERLALLREAIASIQLDTTFVQTLERRSLATFGKPLGEQAVFVRSDTNMEDLKSFTGAGLNLTVPNVVGREPILRSIRAVWASPFSERSYRWRQRLLNNPVDVYPSILLLASVPVDRSGVMITSDVATGEAKRLTVSFSRGVGGAVEGQMAETLTIALTGVATLLNPAREPTFAVLPPEGGVKRVAATFEEPILAPSDRRSVRRMAGEIRTRLAQEGMAGPHDVELGFLDGKVMLFQVRPFVENRNAARTAYLNGMDRRIDPRARIDLEERRGGGG